MRKFFSIMLLIFTVMAVNSAPKVSFADLLANAEMNPRITFEAKNLAMNKGFPVTIYTIDRVIMDVKAVEDGKPVYAVYTNFLDIYKGGYAAYYEEIAFRFDAATSKMDFGNGRIIDNTHGMYDPVYSSSNSLVSQFLMITDATSDGVYLFNAQNGDLLESTFIPPTNPALQTPKEALQHFSSRFILVADQISDLVQRFDTNGTYITHFAPSGGVNTSIIDNIRSVTYRPNRNILVTVGSSANQNTVQQFDTGGVHIGTFVASGVNSPFDVIIRASDLLVSNFSGTDRISKCDLNGTFQSYFYSGSNFAGPEQLFEMPNGFVAVAAFSSPSGIALLNPTGTFTRLITGVTGCRGIYLLGNGHYLTTNGAGVHEIDSAAGTLIRTISTATGFQYISEYTPGAILSNGNNQNTLPEGFSLAQNYPNPFNPSTVIKYSVPKASGVRLTVFDAAGREVSVLINGKQDAGTHEVTFDAKAFASGIYYYKLEADGYSDVKKMALIK